MYTFLRSITLHSLFFFISSDVKRVVNNVEKDRKRKASSEDDLPRKRGRPKKIVTSSSCYSPLTVDPSDISQETEALENELKKEKSRRDVLLDLMKATYYSRRREILHDSDTVCAKITTYPALKMPSVVSFSAPYTCINYKGSNCCDIT